MPTVSIVEGHAADVTVLANQSWGELAVSTWTALDPASVGSFGSDGWGLATMANSSNYDSEALAARGESQPPARASHFSPDQGARSLEYR